MANDLRIQSESMMMTSLPSLADIFALDADVQIALIILNQPVAANSTIYEQEAQLLKLVLRKSKLTVCADGGANYLYDLLRESSIKYVPDIIIGDLDSVRSAVKEHYKSSGTNIIHDADQNQNDFMKSVRLILKKESISNVPFDYIIAIGAIQNRFDQTMASVHALHVAAKISSTPLILISPNQYTCLLKPGKHRLSVNTGYEGKWCGILPIGSKCNYIKTTGLKWNLPVEGYEFSFGSLISSSNTFDGSDEVTIENDTNVIWSMGIKNTTTS